MSAGLNNIIYRYYQKYIKICSIHNPDLRLKFFFSEIKKYINKIIPEESYSSEFLFNAGGWLRDLIGGRYGGTKKRGKK